MLLIYGDQNNVAILPYHGRLYIIQRAKIILINENTCRCILDYFFPINPHLRSVKRPSKLLDLRRIHVPISIFRLCFSSTAVGL